MIVVTLSAVKLQTEKLSLWVRKPFLVTVKETVMGKAFATTSSSPRPLDLSVVSLELWAGTLLAVTLSCTWALPKFALL